METREIEDALHVLLSQIEIEEEKPDTRPNRYRLYTISELSKPDDADEIIDRPVRHACAQAVRLLGQRLHEIGLSADDMSSLAERVAARDPKRAGKRINVISKRWNGIGDWWD